MSDPLPLGRTAPIRSRWTPPALWTLALLTITSWPNPDVPNVGEGDKVVHALLYGPLAVLIGRAAPSVTRHPMRAALVAVGLAALAALDEWHQAFIPGRSAGVGDWAADVVGVLVGLAVVTARARRSVRAS